VSEFAIDGAVASDCLFNLGASLLLLLLLLLPPLRSAMSLCVGGSVGRWVNRWPDESRWTMPGYMRTRTHAHTHGQTN